MNARSVLFLAVLVSAACRPSALAPVPQPAPSSPRSASSVDAEAWRTHVPPPGEPGRLQIPAPESVKLENGLRIYALRRETGVVSAGVIVRHGAGSVGEHRTGLAALTARMLTEGTRRHSSLELAEAAEALGSTLSDDAGRDYSGVWMTVLREDLARGLDLIAEVVREPAFAQGELERVRAEWIEHLKDERQDPRRLASLAGLRLLLGPVLGAPVQGSIPDVTRLAVTDLREFHAHAYTPENAALVVVGDVTLEQVRDEARRALGSWRGRAWSDAPVAPPLAPSNQRRIVIVDRPDAVQSALFVAQPFPPRGSAGHEAREILSTLFGGLFTSRINQNLREEHAYTYGANARAVATRAWGAFLVQTTVETKATAAAVEEISKELASLRAESGGRPVTDEEVTRSKAALINSLGEHLETTSAIAADVAELFYEQLPLDYYARYGALVNAVSRDEVQREASQRLEPDRVLVVVVGDRAKLDGSLRAIGASVETANPSLLD